MKRPLQPAQHPTHSIELPLELLPLIAAADDWRQSGPLARTCHATLRLFTQRDVLRTIVELCVERGTLLRWLLFALPCQWLVAMPLCVVPGVKVEQEDADHVFVSGRAVSRLLYELPWKTDVDVWVDDGDRGVSLDDTETRLNIKIGRHGEPVERCIEHFKMSVEQQGYKCYEDTAVSLCTPLALYSWREHVLVVLPLHPMLNLYTDHVGISCMQCATDGWINDAYSQRLKTWRSHIGHYRVQMPEFRVVYCHAPDDARVIDLLVSQ